MTIQRENPTRSRLYAAAEDLSGLDDIEKPVAANFNPKRTFIWLQQNYSFVVCSASAGFDVWLSSQPGALETRWHRFTEQFAAVFINDEEHIITPAIDNNSDVIIRDAIHAGRLNMGFFLRAIYNLDNAGQNEGEYLRRFLRANKHVFSANNCFDVSVIEPVVTAWRNTFHADVDTLRTKLFAIRRFIKASFNDYEFGQWVQTLPADMVARILNFKNEFVEAVRDVDTWDIDKDAIDLQCSARIDGVTIFMKIIIGGNFSDLGNFLEVNPHIYYFLAENFSELEQFYTAYQQSNSLTTTASSSSSSSSSSAIPVALTAGRKRKISSVTTSSTSINADDASASTPSSESKRRVPPEKTAVGQALGSSMAAAFHDESHEVDDTSEVTLETDFKR